MYAHLWGTDELRAVFDEPARLQSWLEILAALARAQATLGLIPASSADAITEAADVSRLDLAYAAAQTRATSHSTLGLIRAFQKILPENARQHVYMGVTVQDITDTWTALTLRQVGAIVWRDLRLIEGQLLELAERHRDTLMVGRTHAQPGAPITFGFKAASWADEVRRHLGRLADGRPRWLVGQLAGSVGVLGFFGANGLPLRAEFCAQLGLADPGISWLTARDRLVEFSQVLAAICGTLARVGGEIYELQRPEIGELREPAIAGGVSSITMPHKRNPERSEHLDTLARLVRANAGALLEAMVQQHERDGRGWKTEWIALPEVCLFTGTALQLTLQILSGLEVDTARMAANVASQSAAITSEQVLAALSVQVGKHQAQAMMQAALHGEDPAAAPVLGAVAAPEGPGIGAPVEVPPAAPAMVDEVVRRARAARAAETKTWPAP
ncbi:MAG TPA: adenylosuccinate lyase family protein [Acidimicrobiales bacterium]|nr:adenylosuccinate lyase family protein [Acidimicrobiales bacterium]